MGKQERFASLVPEAPNKGRGGIRRNPRVVVGEPPDAGRVDVDGLRKELRRARQPKRSRRGKPRA